MTSFAPPYPPDRGAGAGTARLARWLQVGLGRAILTLLRWQELARQRRALLALDEDMLKDIGLTRTDALREAGRPFWDDGSDPWRIWR